MSFMLRRDESWFPYVTDREIDDIVRSGFEVIAPEITRKTTLKGREYYQVQGYKYGKEGLESVLFNLNHYAPVFVRDDGELLIDYKTVNENLTTVKDYIRFMDEKNMGRTVHGLSYKQEANLVYQYVIYSISHVSHVFRC